MAEPVCTSRLQATPGALIVPCLAEAVAEYTGTCPCGHTYQRWLCASCAGLCTIPGPARCIECRVADDPHDCPVTDPEELI